MLRWPGDGPAPPRHRVTAAYHRAVAAAARLLARVLLAPAYLALLVPRRAWLALTRRDPLRLAPPAPGGRRSRPRPRPVRMTSLGISALYHDAAAAVVRDGVIVAAAQEERFSRVKHDPSFPARAIRWCLDAAGVPPGGL